MCCLDYWQEAKFGNIAVAELDEILGGTIAASHRRQVYGLADADANLLCRKCCHIRRGTSAVGIPHGVTNLALNGGDRLDTEGPLVQIPRW